jgi:hypothetical protein
MYHRVFDRKFNEELSDFPKKSFKLIVTYNTDHIYMNIFS